MVGMVWYGMVLYGMVWYGKWLVWYAMLCYDKTLFYYANPYNKLYKTPMVFNGLKAVIANK
jgi:hypothetical protein